MVKYNWIVNLDADEFLEHPWKDEGINLKESIKRIHNRGYNIIGCNLYNFYTHEDDIEGDPRLIKQCKRMTHVGPKTMMRIFKRDDKFSVSGSGGHVLYGNGSKIKMSNISFMLKHYPLRGTNHYKRKVIKERLPIYASSEKARGWHVQYNKKYQDLIPSEKDLLHYDRDSVYKMYLKISGL